ncbi:uncharacterized protein [Halyomorpha halys]|uniref:uncharacterized protein n=1 Tax=Halyomorpha halys TaxID=286706 RepID=UPI0006D50C0A|nr:uncharacterized protein LOC106690896 [Halyomorpha halys]
MKLVLVFFLVTCMATLGMTHEDWSPGKPCIQYDCLHDPNANRVCGKYIDKNGCVKEVIFQSECHFLSANSCGRSLAILCSSHETKPCIMYKCSTVWDPVCGTQIQNGCKQEKIFTNACHMASANSCGKANWVPCVENKCENHKHHDAALS